MANMWVDIDLADVDDEELIDEIQARGYKVHEDAPSLTILENIYHLRRQGKPYEAELDNYIRDTLGKVI
mgnify:CR=1 FL=1